MRLLLLDNYDSFTYNLAHLLRELGCADLTVLRNDKVALSDLGSFDRIVLSPGPGIPSEAGIMPELVREYSSSKPIMGVCLGHQCIAEVFGARLTNMDQVVHGKATAIEIVDDTEGLFKNIPSQISVGRYHSWIVDSTSFPEQLIVTAIDQFKQIMALRHRHFNLRGVQFHPESILTEYGAEMLRNWLEL